MSEKTNIKVLERVSKKVKDKTTTKMVEVSAKTPEEAIAGLKKKGAKYFEVVDEVSNTKIQYTRMLSGKNYVKKQVILKKK